MNSCLAAGSGPVYNNINNPVTSSKVELSALLLKHLFTNDQVTDLQ